MTTEANIRDVLATIPDPEMPISITDLGLVNAVRIENVTKRPSSSQRSAGRSQPSAGSGQQPAVSSQRSAVSRQQSALGTRNSERGTRNSERGTQNSELGTQNSELGTQNSELGTQNSERGTQNSERGTQNSERGTRYSAIVDVRIDLLPTFVGCPALGMLRQQICERVGELPGVRAVTVRFLNDPLWTTDRISDAGRAALREHGVTVPGQRIACGDASAAAGAGQVVPLTVSTAAEPLRCPFCDSTDTALESRFGPTRCRMIYYCKACKNSFEHMKRV